MIKLRDKTFVLTGANTDIGYSLATSLSQQGADLAIIDRNSEKSIRLINQLNESRATQENNGKSLFIESDLTMLSSVKEAMSKATETFGGIDVVIAGLQITHMALVYDSNYVDELERLISVNTKSAVYLASAVMPFMKGRKKGKILFLISDLIRWGAPGESLAAITSGGLVFYVKSLARELAPHNITVNCIAVGPTEDSLLAKEPKSSSIKSAEEKLMEVIPMKRMMSPHEIAQVIMFLSSSQSDGVTGQTWSVSGGLTMF